MAGRVAVVLALGLGGALCLAPAWDCVVPYKVVEKDEFGTLYSKTASQPLKTMSTSLYVKPGSDFKAVCIRASDETVRPPPEACFPGESLHLNSAAWNVLEVEVEVVSTFFSIRLRFRLKSNSYTKTKEKSYSSPAITHISLLANGTSEWIYKAPTDACPDATTEIPSSGPPPTPDATSENTCSGPPPSTPALHVVVAVLAWVAAAVVAAAVAQQVETHKVLTEAAAILERR